MVTIEIDQKKLIIVSIRAHFEAFGYDMSEYTDEEIEQAVINMSKPVARSGVTTQQADDALAGIGRL
jgi:hypothetical protein